MKYNELQPSHHIIVMVLFYQPRVSRPNFRLETNSTVVWLYAGGVSFILPDVRFGMVSLDWVTYEKQTRSMHFNP